MSFQLTSPRPNSMSKMSKIPKILSFSPIKVGMKKYKSKKLSKAKTPNYDPVQDDNL